MILQYLTVERSILFALLAQYAEQGLCNGTVSVCLSRLSTAAAACGEFAALGPAGRRYRSIAARRALSSNCEQCHVVS